MLSKILGCLALWFDSPLSVTWQFFVYIFFFSCGGKPSALCFTPIGPHLWIRLTQGSFEQSLLCSFLYLCQHGCTHTQIHRTNPYGLYALHLYQMFHSPLYSTFSLHSLSSFVIQNHAVSPAVICRLPGSPWRERKRGTERESEIKSERERERMWALQERERKRKMHQL